jgi:hypothetical protein
MELIKMKDGSTLNAYILHIKSLGEYTIGKTSNNETRVVHLEDGWHEYDSELIACIRQFTQQCKKKSFTYEKDTLQIINPSLILCKVKSTIYDSYYFCIFKDFQMTLLEINEYHNLKRYTNIYEDNYIKE